MSKRYAGGSTSHMGVFQCPYRAMGGTSPEKGMWNIMANHGLATPHEKRITCGTCGHPKMSRTREHVKCCPFPQQKNAATSKG